MDVVLQIWGGLFYLANKVLFSISEGRNSPLSRKLRIGGWVAYILGVPAWVVILVGNQNWIAASIEAGGVPAMLLGLYVAWFNNKKPNKSAYFLVTVLTYLSLSIGIGNSLIQHGGITSITQVLEIGVMFGFLLSGYYMAKLNPVGWLYFMLGNISMAALMYIENAPILMVQQLVSLIFVFYGFKNSKKYR